MNTNTNARGERDIYFQYLSDISRYPLLSREQEKVLLAKIKEGSREAMNLLVKSNLRFVVNIAHLYKGQGLELGELISEGNLGLMEAARRFDASQKIKFISYAVWWVRQNITRAIAEKGRMVRISAEKELVLRRFNKKGGKLRQVVGGGYVLDPDSLEGVSKYKSEDIEKILMMGSRSSSLDAPVGDDESSTLGECLAVEDCCTDELAEVNDRRDVFNKVIDEKLDIRYMTFLRIEKEFDEELLSLLYKSGLRLVHWGVESGSNRILKFVDKGITAEISEGVLRAAHKVGIFNHIFMMFGFPTETKEERQMSLDYIKRNMEYIDSMKMLRLSIEKDSLFGKYPERYGFKLNSFQKTNCVGGNANSHTIPYLREITFLSTYYKMFEGELEKLTYFYFRGEGLLHAIKRAEERENL